MDRIGAFKQIKRRERPVVSVRKRIRSFREIYRALPEDVIAEQSRRCMECGTPFCHGYGCPLGNYIPDWIDLVYSGKWESALRMLEKTSNFPEFTARVCPALCESACVLGLEFEPVTIRTIEFTVIEKGFEQGWVQPCPPSGRTGRRVAVIGSGPAGLAAADMLNRCGHTVEVFEKDRKPGGLLRYGIPDFKIEKTVIDRRLDILRQEGITFICDVEIGVDISPGYLLKKYDAVIPAVGCRRPRDLAVPGREHKGICFALDYLSEQNRINEGVSPSSDLLCAQDKKVVVIGGGDTGADCVGTAVRQGASEVIQLEILPKPPAERTSDMEWPVHPNIYRKSPSHEEGGIQHWSVLTSAFKGAEGRVTACSCAEARMESGTFVPVSGTEFEVEAQLVIIAAGFTGPEEASVLESLGIGINNRGLIEEPADPAHGIFAAGDAVSGPSLVVRAIARGRSSALQADEYLRDL